MASNYLDASLSEDRNLFKRLLSQHWPPMRPTSGGMQVHAVPEDERAVDSNGRPLPWGYSYADSNLNRKFPMEHGPFGKSTNRRATSRSKTATPATKEDVLRLDNQRIQDEIFSKFKLELEEQQQKQPSRADSSLTQTKVSSLQQSRSTLDNATVSGPPITSGPVIISKSTLLPEPTEVLLYGFAADQAYAAIDFYETASNGKIYEDYDRLPPHPRYSAALSSPHSQIPRSLDKEARRKINEYKGGDHWIKVTFDSPEAAELACHISPHIINGFSVFAELWRGVGPTADVAISATGAGGKSAGTIGRMETGTQMAELSRKEFSSLPTRKNVMPGPWQSRTSGYGFADSTSSTETFDGSSATATGSEATANGINSSPSRTHRLTGQSTSSEINEQHLHNRKSNNDKPLRIPTATRLTLQPASAALLPVPPWTQRTLGHLPLIGSLFGGPSTTTNVIGAEVPRNEKGEFDWDRASLWWRTCWWLDSVFGTDLCGMKPDE